MDPVDLADEKKLVFPMKGVVNGNSVVDSKQ